MRTTLLLLLALATSSCAKPPEATLLPRPLNDLRFGASSAAVSKTRPSTKPVKCSDPYSGSEYACLVELNPVPGFENARYAFKRDELVAISLSSPVMFWPDTNVAGLRDVVPNLEGVGLPSVRIQLDATTLSWSATWLTRGYTLQLRSHLNDGAVLPTRSGAAGTLVITGLTLTGREGTPEPNPAKPPDAEVLEGDNIGLDAVGKLTKVFTEGNEAKAKLLALLEKGSVDPEACSYVPGIADLPEAPCRTLLEGARTGRFPPDAKESLGQHLHEREQFFSGRADPLRQIYEKILKERSGDATAAAARDALIAILRRRVD